MVRFDLLPFITFNDYQDLSNEEFLDRIHEPIDSEEIAVSSNRTLSDSNPHVSDIIYSRAKF